MTAGFLRVSVLLDHQGGVGEGVDHLDPTGALTALLVVDTLIAEVDRVACITEEGEVEVRPVGM